MTIEELKQLLNAGEWNDVEFKEARNEVPKSAYETVCSFSNTHGGWLVFGISQTGERFEITGVNSPDKLQNDFFSVLHAGGKINHDVQVSEERLVFDGKTVLVFHISENSRSLKPVYLDGDIRRTFLRKGGGDYRAQMQDIERLLRDAAGDRWDGQVFERVTLDEAFDNSSLKWYRNRFHQYNEGFDPGQPDTEFLMDWGYIVKEGKELKPIRAAIILFGSPRAVHQLIPRPTLDVQFLPYGIHDEMPETRWIDRFLSESNIIQTWQQLVAKYKFFMPKPFLDIDPHTLARQDTPPGFRVFREAAVNLLIHQDYGDHSRKATIKFFQDGIQFWNPGDVFGDDSRLLEPGEKEVRNPAITAAMRRIVLCEQAGTGLRMMRKEWQKLGHSAPILRNDRSLKAFEFFIPGLDSEFDAASNLMKAVSRVKNTFTPGTSEQVKAQEAQGEAQDPQFNLTPLEIAILEACQDDPRTSRELLTAAGYSSRTGNFKRSIDRLLTYRLIQMTTPDKPRSSRQKYRLTEKGQHLLVRRKENCLKG
jgi:ATP-dependent DNA helicase RecG